MNKEKYIGESALNDKPGKKINLMIRDASITTPKLADVSVTTEKLADGAVSKDKLDSTIYQEITDSVTASNEATEKAKEATIKAEQATAAATAAKEAADNATQLATNATTASNQATELAKDATTKADDATARANEAAQKADDSREQTEQTLGTMQEVIDKVAIKDDEGTMVETPFRYIQSEEFIFAKVDANDKLLFGIQWDGTPVFGKTSAVEDRLQSQVTLLAERVATIMGDEDTTNVIDTMNELKKFFAEIENTETLTGILANLDNVAKNLDKTTIKDEEGNVQDTPFRVIENEEFIMAVVDSEDRVLFGIYRKTGKSYYPLNDMYHIAQSEEFLWVILDAANHPLLGIQQDGTCWAAKAQWLDDIKAIKEALSSIDETLKTFQPKEDGKGLIDIEIADSFFYISNDEYLVAVVDAENRTLAGIKYDGEPYFPNHEMYSIITNEEWLYAIIDAEGKLLGGFRSDDGHMMVGSIDISTFISNAIVDISDIKERIAHLSIIDNDEYLSVETDSDGKVIGYTAPDGSHYLYKIKSETIPTEFEHIEDPEGRTEITTDSENKILGYRDSEGKRHEHDMEVTNLDVSNLNLQGNSVNNIQEALKANGFNVKTPIDWSENIKIQIPEPRLAFVNITNIDSMPTSKGQDMHAIFEFWDMQGNYFKKKVILNAQGNSSLGMPKKNFACDFCNDDWKGDDTFKIKFGNWVSQDSFHFKAFYADFFKGVSMVGYKLFNEIELTRSFNTNRIWKRALLPSADTIGFGTKGMESITDVNILIDNGARCYPDGFPCIVHLNGSFYGVFSWALKKHRDNYMQNKSKPENIQLDGDIYDTFMYNGNIDWDVVNGTKASSGGGNDGFEFRNPKSLICIDGTKYDADNNRKELIDSTSEHYDASNKNHVNTNKVKGYYKTLTTYIPTLKKMEEQSEEESVIKNKIQSFFDVDSLIDYLIFSDVVSNYDGFRKNWQWLTYNGAKWAVAPYDLDGIAGWNGWSEQSPDSERFGNTLDLPTGWVIKYFDTELCERYKELRANVLTTTNIFGLLRNWCSRIGASNYDKDLSKWALTPDVYPVFSEPHYDNIYRVSIWIEKRLKKCDSIYKLN